MQDDDDTLVVIEPLPTTEPTEDGLLWNDNGVLTRSGPPFPDLPDLDENEDEEC